MGELVGCCSPPGRGGKLEEAVLVVEAEALHRAAAPLTAAAVAAAEGAAAFAGLGVLNRTCGADDSAGA